ncbi:MAG: InlB B-repeat-containing protein, partial [Clostridia bacterium]|nr:InlB B-repeat-containing protein [Clostridia bacterium]
MGKKKIIGFIIGIAMSCAATSVVSACKFSDGSSETNSSSSSSVQTPASVEYKVTFDSAGGSSVKAQYVTKGEKAQQPAENPTREGYTFVEWQLNGKTYNFEAVVVSDITLKAKWEKNAPTKFAVSFMVE